MYIHQQMGRSVRHVRLAMNAQVILKRALYPMKRAPYPIERALYLIKKSLISITQSSLRVAKEISPKLRMPLSKGI